MLTFAQSMLGFAAVAAILTIVPGLDTTLVLRSALTNGRRHAIMTALGINAGTLVWGAAAAVGATALLAVSEVAYRVVAIAGALYMGYLGVSLIVKSFRRAAIADSEAVEGERGGTSSRAFLTGLWTNLLNPKVGVFYIATIPQFIPAGASHLGMGILLAGVHVCIGFLWFALLIGGATAARRWLAQERATRIIDRIAGAVLIGFGTKLALEYRV